MTSGHGTSGDAQPANEVPAPGEPAGERAPDRAVDDIVPKLPRGRGLRLSRTELVRVAGLAVLLVFLVATQRRCADAVSTFVTSFGDQRPSAAMPRPGAVDMPPAASSTGASPAGPSAPATGPAGTGAGEPASNPGFNGDDYEHVRAGMTEQEIEAAIERARAKARARRQQGSGAPGEAQHSVGPAPAASPTR